MSIARDNVDLLRELLASGGGSGDQGILFVQNLTGFDGASITPDTDTTVALNNETVNTIAGASLTDDQITLPAGTYQVFARSPFYCAANAAPHAAWLYDTAAPGGVLDGKHAYASAGQNSDATVLGQFVTEAEAVLELRHRTTGAITAILGKVSGVGVSGSLAEVFIRKVA